MPQGRLCLTCSAPLIRKRSPRGRLESNLNFRARLYCDKACYMDRSLKIGVQRQTLLKRAARAMPKEACTRCGTPNDLRMVFRDGDALNCHPDNLDVLCRPCRDGPAYRPPRKPTGPPCAYCGKPSMRASLCVKHYTSKRRHGDPLRTERVKRAKGPHPK